MYHHGLISSFSAFFLKTYSVKKRTVLIFFNTTSVVPRTITGMTSKSELVNEVWIRTNKWMIWKCAITYHTTLWWPPSPMPTANKIKPYYPTWQSRPSSLTWLCLDCLLISATPFLNSVYPECLRKHHTIYLLYDAVHFLMPGTSLINTSILKLLFTKLFSLF